MFEIEIKGTTTINAFLGNKKILHKVGGWSIQKNTHRFGKQSIIKEIIVRIGYPKRLKDNIIKKKDELKD